jgi:hypothetical protein
MSISEELNIEERLKKHEEAIEALKDVPNMLAELMGNKKPEGKETTKPTWDFGDEESNHDDMDMLINGETSKDDGNANIFYKINNEKK